MAWRKASVSIEGFFIGHIPPVTCTGHCCVISSFYKAKQFFVGHLTTILHSDLDTWTWGGSFQLTVIKVEN